MSEEERAWAWLLENGVVGEETLRVVTDINGFNMETMQDVLYSVSGERAFPWEDEEDE